jgi:hypothetical protein
MDFADWHAGAPGKKRRISSLPLEQTDDRMQLTLPTMTAAPERPATSRRRELWRELARVAAFHGDQRVRDAARHDAALAGLGLQLEDIRARLRDVERAAGLADIATAPQTRPQLRAYANGR